MSRLMQNAPKFFHPEWVLAQARHNSVAEGEVAAGERLVAESMRCMNQVDELTTKMYNDSNRLIKTRKDELQFWQGELDRMLTAIKEELDKMLALQKRFTRGYDSKQEIENLTRHCMNARQRREGIYLVADELEKQLIKELEVAQGVEALYVRTMEQITEQIRLLRKVRYAIEKHMTDKGLAIAIDNFNLELKVKALLLDDINNSSNSNKNSENNWVDYSNWLERSNELVKSGERERENSCELRSLAETIIMQTVNDLERQKNNVEVAMENRIFEVRNNKEKLEDQLRRLNVQIKEEEDLIVKLKENIEDKNNYLKLCRARIENRKERRNVELALDEAHYALNKEMEKLMESIAEIERRLCAALLSIRGLDSAKVELLSDLAKCANALSIDDNEVRLLRQSYLHKFF